MAAGTVGMRSAMWIGVTAAALSLRWFAGHVARRARGRVVATDERERAVGLMNGERRRRRTMALVALTGAVSAVVGERRRGCHTRALLQLGVHDVTVWSGAHHHDDEDRARH